MLIINYFNFFGFKQIRHHVMYQVFIFLLFLIAWISVTKHYNWMTYQHPPFAIPSSEAISYFPWSNMCNSVCPIYFYWGPMLEKKYIVEVKKILDSAHMNSWRVKGSLIKLDSYFGVKCLFHFNLPTQSCLSLLWFLL